MEVNQTKLMASLVPDEVIYDVNGYEIRHYDACLMFGDITGFTALCGKFSKTEGGPSQLTQILNVYLGAMIQEIISHNGDVLKFAGDAFLAMWKCTGSLGMREVVHKVIYCALVIQKSYGTYKTDVGVTIKMKLAIAGGPVVFSNIGDEKYSHYVVIGKPVWDAKDAESRTGAGDIVAARTVWKYVKTNEYLGEELPDGLHVKVLGVGPNWRLRTSIQRETKIHQFDDDISYSSSSDSSISLAESEFFIRPTVNLADKMNMKNSLRKFLMPPVLKSIDMEEHFEYLTEMRTVVICFINVTSVNMDFEPFVKLVDNIYKTIANVVDAKLGCVNKVSLFDKGLLFLAIFGLRGFKHDLESQYALRASEEIHYRVNENEHVTSVSIGITSHITYCGVFGHTLRREYTVISPAVNKAARLMCAYENKVTCDRDTYVTAKLHPNNFTLQEYKPLKGIPQPGPIFQFKEVFEDSTVNKYPYVGREKELKAFSTHYKTFMNATDHQSKILIFKAGSRGGKTKLLNEIIQTSSHLGSFFRYNLNYKDGSIKFNAVQSSRAKNDIIVIDNYNYIDADSLEVLTSILNRKKTFVLATSNLKNEEIEKFYNATVVKFDALRKDCLTALACQILDVFAIASELEMAITSNSNGDPGWIEGYLISARLANELQITSMKVDVIPKHQLVFPRGIVIERDFLKNVEIVKKQRAKSENSVDLGLPAEWEQRLQKVPTIPVCMITAQFDPDIIIDEHTRAMDVIVLRIFDSLTSFEQLLVKCSVTLGYSFPRKMLFYVMASNDPRPEALAIKKLFEKNVLVCATVCEETSTISSVDDNEHLKCRCKNVEIDPLCQDLPKYASCEHLEFDKKIFRDATYNLLTNVQKKNFHRKAILYLTKETRRCDFCGGGIFSQIWGAKHDRGLRMRLRRHVKVNQSIYDNRSYDSFNDPSIYRRSFIDEGSDDETLIYKTKISRGGFGLNILKRLKKCPILVRSFQSVDFTHCECPEILKLVFHQMVDHCKGAGLPTSFQLGNLDKMVDSMLKYAELCIFSCNVHLAIKTLKEALNYMSAKTQSGKETFNAWEVLAIRGKIYSLLGHAYSECEDNANALKYFTEAMEDFGYPFPTNNLSKQLKTMKMRLRGFFSLYCFPSQCTSHLKLWEAEYYNNLSECLQFMCTYYMKIKLWKQAELAGYWSYIEGIRASTSFKVVCNAYTNMILIAQFYNRIKCAHALEIYALRFCHFKRTTVEFDEIAVIGRLYGVIFLARIQRGDVHASLTIGVNALNIFKTVQSLKACLIFMPNLMYHFLLSGYVSDAVTIVYTLQTLAMKDSANSVEGMIWCYILSLCFTLDTGFVIVPFSVCEEFYDSQVCKITLSNIPEVERMYVTVLWLYSIRLGEWEKERYWRTKLPIGNFKSHNSFHLVAYCFFTEGLILLMVYGIPYHKLEQHIISSLNTMQKAVDRWRMVKARILHLQAYYKIVKQYDNAPFKLLEVANNVAESNLNIMRVVSIKLSQKSWRDINPIDNHEWKEQVDISELYDTSKPRKLRIFLYVLPNQVSRKSEETINKII